MDQKHDMSICPKCVNRVPSKKVKMVAIEHHYFDLPSEEKYYILECPECSYDYQGTTTDLAGVKAYGIKKIKPFIPKPVTTSTTSESISPLALKYVVQNSEALKLRFEGTDLFCGAGGVTEGIHRARYKRKKIATVRSCVNHDPIAIQTHSINHKYVHHFTEDITTQDAKDLFKPTNSLFNRTFLHGSLECTNHSGAKGGMSRDPDSRTLAWHLYKYIDHLEPDYITIENVEEFKDWGPVEIKVEKKLMPGGYYAEYCPLDITSKGKGKKKKVTIKPTWVPIKHLMGTYFNPWVAEVNSRGYTVEYKMLNCADFGDYTSRERLIMIFAKVGLPIVWPKPTHDKHGRNGLKKWKAVKKVLDLNDEGQSIFNRKYNPDVVKRHRRDLKENSLARIYDGLIAHIAGGKKAFAEKKAQYDQLPEDFKSVSLDESNIDVTRDWWMNGYYSTGGSQVNDMNKPCPTLSTHDRFSPIVVLRFIDKQYGSVGGNHQSLEQPAGTIMKNDKHCLMSLNKWIDKMYNGKTQHQSIEGPAHTLLQVPKLRLVYADKMIVSQNFRNTPTSIEGPMPVITADGHWHYIVDAQYNNVGRTVEKPCQTLIARMDKYPPYLVDVKYSDLAVTDQGELGIVVFESDSYYTKKIKEFMAIYGILDIKMRMLSIPELKRITGFADDYVLLGSKTIQKKFIGNAVPPNLMKVVYEALYEANLEYVEKQLSDRKDKQLKIAA